MTDQAIGIGSRLRHSQYGDGILTRISLEYFTINFFKGGSRTINRKSEELEVVEAVEPETSTLTLDEVEEALVNILDRYHKNEEVVPLGSRWTGGNLILQPGDPTLQEKELPIETFFHKIVMVRDRLRVLEQNINSHKNLTDEEKVNLQQYITRIYGSLTTFNVLFRDKVHHFKGEGGK